MNEPQGVWWDVIKTASNVIALALAAGFGWLAKRFSRIEERMKDMETDYVQRDAAAVVQIATLRAYHEANIQRLTSIESSTKEISQKQDQLLMLILQERRET